MLAVAASLAAMPALAADAAIQSLTPFSGNKPGTALPPAWQHQVLRGVEPNRHLLVADQDTTVLRIDVDRSASSVVHAVPMALRDARSLRWRWRAHALPAGGRLGERDGDDFAARLYLMFDYPLDRLGLADRIALRLARAVNGPSVPAAAICYVWNATPAPVEVIDSPFTGRVRMIVARNGPGGRWHEEQRDVERDFRLAFGAEHGEGRAPLMAIALAADGDQTGARFTTEFGDVDLS